MYTSRLGREPSDLDLLERWCEGEDEAGDHLLRRYFPLLYRFFINKVGDATEDLVQQTLMGCMRYRESMRESGVVRMFMFRIARSRLYDHIRALRRRGGHVDCDFNVLSVADGGTSNTSLLGRERAAQQIRDALRELPVDLQMVVELHFWEGLSTREIAEIIEVPQGTVKSRIRRAKEALETALEVDAPEVLERLGRARPELDE